MRVLGIIIVAIVAAGCLVCLADRLWYKKHPGAEEEFSKIDEELKNRGQ